jgi:P4 family phage/plasmid primase-like protien
MNQKQAQETLRAWGIESQAIEMKWSYHRHVNQAGFAYPIPERESDGLIALGTVLMRWKNVEPNVKHKNLWLLEKPDECLSLYFPPSIQKAIEKDNGRLFIVEGEKDVLTMMAAGIYNVLTWLDGASNISPFLLEVLQEFDVREVIHIPDLDEAGRKSASKLSQILASTQIAYKALELPAELGEKGDVNDLWIHLEFNKDTFVDALDNLPELSIQADSGLEAAQVLARPKSKGGQTDKPNEFPPAFISAIEQALGVERYRKNGWSNRVHCPFHEDTNPSAQWNRELQILKCHAGCAPEGRDNFLALQVAEKLNIRLKDYTQRHGTISILPSSAEAHALLNTTSQTETLSDSKPPKLNHIQLGKRVLSLWDGDWAFIYGDWHNYSSGVWRKISPQGAEKSVWDSLDVLTEVGAKGNRSEKDAVLDYLEAQLTVSKDLADAGWNYCNLQNGVFNLTTLELESHQRDLFLTSQFGFSYDAEALCPRWLVFLNEVFQSNQELVNLMQEAVGYTLTSETRFEATFWLLGEGSTGKSTILRLLKRLMGSSAIELDLNTLARNSYQTVDIFGKRLITCSEVESGSKLAAGFIKRLVSGEELVARQIRSMTTRGETIGKLWWAMNELPHNSDKSNAIYRRVIILPCDNAIPKEKRNHNLLSELTQELPGIFNWAIEGWKRLQNRGYFPEVQEVTQAVEAYRSANDIEGSFLEDTEWIMPNENASIKASELYMGLKLWAERNGHRNIPSSKTAASSWLRLGLEKIDKRDANYYKGIAFTEAAANMILHQKKLSGEVKVN